jgi:mono/diheme cytochrome c family protein
MCSPDERSDSRDGPFDLPRPLNPHIAAIMRATAGEAPFADVGGPPKLVQMQFPTSLRPALWWLSAALASSPCLAADAAQVERGATLYAQRCEGCHGQGLRNTSGGWSFDLRKLKPDDHERFVESVITGKDNMPSWYGILKDDEIDAIWSYIRAMVDK